MNEKLIDKKAIYQELRNILREESILVQEPLKNHTTFLVGGPADFLILPNSIEEVQNSVILCKKYSIPFYLIGNGSNLLVGDKGYRGIIIKLAKNLSNVEILEDHKNKHEVIIKADSGILLEDLSKFIASNQLTGFEFACGIPGTLGGAVAMNAGAYDGEIKDCIMSATVMDLEGNVRSLSKDQLKLGYRKSIIQEDKLIVLDATFAFQIGNQQEIDEKIADLTYKRESKQPLEMPSAGSTFKRPEGYYASKLIMDANLRGFSYGRASVSEKHCGFVVNNGDCTAEEILTLIHKIIEVIKNKDGVTLEPEVRILGDFSN